MRKLAIVAMGLTGLMLTAAAPIRDVPIADAQKTATQKTANRPLPPQYRLATVERGEAVAKVIAAGTVQPSTSVVVGSQVSGQVKEVLADHNDLVTQGQPIARIDPQLFATRIAQAQADVDVADNALRIARSSIAASVAAVAQAEAERARTDADAKRSEVVVGNARRRLERKSLLMKSGSSTASETEDAQAAYDVALAEANAARAFVKAREAQVRQASGDLAVVWSRVGHAEAQLRRSQAALRQAEADLERTVIRAPADGLVIERSVSAGQTVAASFQAPSLFTIGDLRAVAVEVAIDEADIGRIQAGQKASFSVDAYPDQVFAGSITQVRRAPHTQETVVTYMVVLTADNEDLRLFPGMTAKAEIVTDRNPDALQVPTAALRYRPQGMTQPSGSHVWVFDGHSIRPVVVRVGVSEADTTEVAGALDEGQTVVLADVGNMNTGTPSLVWRQFGMRVADWMQPVQAALAGMVQR
jgi:HlyD family secretion protein